MKQWQPNLNIGYITINAVNTTVFIKSYYHMYKMYSIMFAVYILRDVICYWISVKTLNKYIENRESWS